jgi:uncharacterized heparinase superfamily protein
MVLLTKLQRLYHTVKPLRFEQVWYRARYNKFPLLRLKNATYHAGHQDWCWQGPEVIESSFLGEGKVKFLKVSAEIISKADWNNGSFDKLWLYNLHYFDDLNAINSASRKDEQLLLVKRWITENPPVKGNGWEPYPLSLRLVNLIKWYYRAHIDDHEILASIAQQAEALSKKLEYHILGNHLFANAKALIFVGCFLQGERANKYLKLGIKLLKREIPEQFLADGGHFELSPMYHCILLWDLLDLINLATLSGNKAITQHLAIWRQYAKRALNWLGIMKHPDGEVSFFNDSAIGIAASPEQLLSYAATLELTPGIAAAARLVTLPESGYSRISMPEHALLFDHGAVGPDYLPAHAHADTLSFEWSVGNERVFVNSGTSIYGVSEERLRQRKTAAHNTVEVDSADSSEVWSGFRVARRAYAKLEYAEHLTGSVKLTASHDGYQRLKGRVTHQRSIDARLTQLTLTDFLSGKYHSAIAHFHLHPAVKVEVEDDFNILLTLHSGKRLRFFSSHPVAVSPSTWHPKFGETVASSKITTPFLSDSLSTTVTII